MTSHMTKPARGNGTGFRDVVSWHGRDTRNDTLLPVDLQVQFLASRFGLAADRARLVAALAFGEAR